MITKAEEYLMAFQAVVNLEDDCGSGESRGACQTIARRIADLIDGEVVCGYVRMPQGQMQHWWVRKDGRHIDPLAILWMDEPMTHDVVKVIE